MRAMLKRVSFAVLVLVLTAVLSGCGGNPLEGAWTMSALGVTVMTVTFRNNGTMAVSSMGASVEGKYSVKGDKVTLTITDSSLPPGAGISSGETAFSVSGDRLNLGGIELMRVK